MRSFTDNLLILLLSVKFGRRGMMNLFLVFSLMLIKKSELGVNFVTSLHREHLKN